MNNMWVLFGWRKVTKEFVKRMDPDLPFYYSTSAHCRFYIGELPDVNTKSTNPPSPKHLTLYELLQTNKRVTFAVHQSASIHAIFHNFAIDLPPPPGTYNQVLHEHSYTNQE